MYCAWAEMHVRHNNIDSAIEILRYAVSKPKRRATQKEKGSRGSLANNVRAWSFLIDLLEATGSFDEAKWAYERLIESKIATPESILHFASFLQRNNFWEESFRVFEKAVQMFEWPHIYEIWVVYLTAVIQRLAGTKVERVRHLFG